MGMLLLQTIGSLTAVLGLMAGLAYLLKKWMYGTNQRRYSEVPIHVVGHRTLQPKRSVYALEVLGKTLIVGVSEAGIQTLTEMNTPVSRGSEESSEAEAKYRDLDTATFASYLKENLGFVKPRHSGFFRMKQRGAR